jgi:hypothetical protein
MSDAPEFFKCSDVIASDRGIIETEAGRQMQLVPRESIRSITLRYGSAAHRPVLEMIAGMALTSASVFDLSRIVVTGKWSRYDIGILVFGLIGGYMIYSVARKTHYLHIITDSTHFKIRFSPNATKEEIKLFCETIKKSGTTNYPTRRSLASELIG